MLEEITLSGNQWRCFSIRMMCTLEVHRLQDGLHNFAFSKIYQSKTEGDQQRKNCRTGKYKRNNKMFSVRVCKMGPFLKSQKRPNLRRRVCCVKHFKCDVPQQAVTRVLLVTL